MERILLDPFRAGGNPPCIYKRSCRCRHNFLLPESLLALQQFGEEPPSTSDEHASMCRTVRWLIPDWWGSLLLLWYIWRCRRGMDMTILLFGSFRDLICLCRVYKFINCIDFNIQSIFKDCFSHLIGEPSYKSSGYNVIIQFLSHISVPPPSAKIARSNFNWASCITELWMNQLYSPMITDTNVQFTYVFTSITWSWYHFLLHQWVLVLLIIYIHDHDWALLVETSRGISLGSWAKSRTQKLKNYQCMVWCS